MRRSADVVRWMRRAEHPPLRRLLPEAGPVRAAAKVVLALSGLRGQVPAAGAMPRCRQLRGRLLPKGVPDVPAVYSLRRVDKVTLESRLPNCSASKNIPGGRATAGDDVSSSRDSPAYRADAAAWQHRSSAAQQASLSTQHSGMSAAAALFAAAPQQDA